MPQTVDMTIELRPGAHAHLHLKKNCPPPKVNLTPTVPGDLQVQWNVIVDSSANSIGLAAVTLWFPHVSPLFIQSIVSPIPVREVTILAGGNAMLTLNPMFDRGGLPSTVNFRIPFAIYCTVDGGQSAGPPHGHGLHQPGRQMVDGHHSHPECEVGP